MEIPEWIAADPELVETVQASVQKDSSITDYSYAFSQAHTQAVIPFDLIESFRQEAMRKYRQAVGHVVSIYAKQRFKNAGYQ